MKNKLPVLSILIMFSWISYPQQGNSEEFIDDMLLLAGNFAKPAAEGVGYQSSAGWFSSAAVLEPWDLRFSVQGNALFVPEKQESYTLRQSELGLLSIEDASSVKIPTAFGGTTGAYFSGEVTFLNPLSGEFETEEIRFKGFDGINLNYVPHAFAQLAVGLPFDTEVTVRATPEVTIDDVTTSTIGIGAKHNLSRYFNSPGDRDFQLAIAVAYSRLNVEYAFDPIEIRDYLSMDLITVGGNLFMAEVVGSKSWGIFEPFVALGAINSGFDYEIGGGGWALDRVNDEIRELADTEASLKADFGFNLHYKRFRFTTMATVGEFFNANVGLYVRI